MYLLGDAIANYPPRWAEQRNTLGCKDHASWGRKDGSEGVVTQGARLLLVHPVPVIAWCIIRERIIIARSLAVFLKRSSSPEETAPLFPACPVDHSRVPRSLHPAARLRSINAPARYPPALIVRYNSGERNFSREESRAHPLEIGSERRTRKCTHECGGWGFPARKIGASREGDGEMDEKEEEKRRRKWKKNRADGQGKGGKWRRREAFRNDGRGWNKMGDSGKRRKM